MKDLNVHIFAQCLNCCSQEGSDNGFYEGKNQGYLDGSYAEQKQCKKILSQELKKAYQNGYDSAESSCYQRGFEAGHTAGFKECEDKFEQQAWEYSGYILLPSSILRGSTLLPTLQLTTSAALPSPLTPGTQFADDDYIPS
jgi:flagellar biosynthesis/type III secretory pathway protein FliH